MIYMKVEIIEYSFYISMKMYEDEKLYTKPKFTGHFFQCVWMVLMNDFDFHVYNWGFYYVPNQYFYSEKDKNETNWHTHSNDGFKKNQ